MSDTITIEDKEYKVDDLTPLQKYLIRQIQEMDKGIAMDKFHLDTKQTAREGFSTKLQNEMSEKK